MHIFAIVAGIVILFAVLLDAFETVVLPRRVRRQFRITSWFYRNTWVPWARLASHIKSQTRRETFLGYFGPLSMILLLGLWACGLIFAFALLQYGSGEHLLTGNLQINFRLLLYHSGETFFTLGYGDITPASGFSRVLSVAEAGLGFAFLGVVIGYLPTIYSAFSRREIEISWLGALTVVLDATALVIAGIDGISNEQARWTFKMARHAVVDLAQVVVARFDPDAPERLTPADLAQIRSRLSQQGLKLRDSSEAEQKLAQLRQQYEPYCQGIARNLYITLPPWIRHDHIRDNWQAGPWDRMIQAQALGRISGDRRGIADEHF